MLYDGAFDEARVKMVKIGEEEEEEDVKEWDDKEKEVCKGEEVVEKAVSVTTWQAGDFSDLLNQETSQAGIEELDKGNGSTDLSEERSTTIGMAEEKQCLDLCEEKEVVCDNEAMLEECDLVDEDEGGESVDEEVEDVKDEAVGKEGERGQLLQDTATQVHLTSTYRVVFLTGPPDFQYQNEKNLLSQRGAFLH